MLGDITENFNLRNKDKIQYPMFSVTNDRGFVPQSEQFEGRDMVGEDIKAYKIIHTNDFAYNPARINVGSIAMYTGERPCMISSLYVCFKTTKEVNNEWLMQLLKTPKMNYYYNVNGEGGVRVYLFYPNFARIRMSIPKIEEQKKIAKLLNLIDERIATQNKIIEDLKKLKSAISENLFKAVKGDVVILSEICEIIKGKQVNSEFLSEKGKYYVMNGGTEPSGYYSDYNVEANTISISEGGNSCGYVQFNTSPFWSGGHCYTIQKIADNVDHLYLYHYLKSKEDAIMKLRIGSGLPNIQKKDLAMFKIKLPTVEQQKSISTFLSSLERKAEIEERIRNSILDEKRCLLHQMFI
ncbi:MAG: restriction endonuclease subunit S [Prevotella sp.]|nr:restriction endonuclease subunit S [Prevotella sp.]